MSSPITLPANGLSADALTQQMDAVRAHDLDWRSGRTFAYVYDAGKSAERVGKQAYMSFLSENALDPTAFPSLLKFENDLVAIALDHLNAPTDAAGTFTSGGTESIILAMKTARDQAAAAAAATGRAAGTPSIVLPSTAHAAFHKGASYLGFRKIIVDVDPQTYRADTEAMAAAIEPSTIMMVASSPSYAHGVIDPVAALGELAESRGLWLHVDACVGGWLLPFYEGAGGEPVTFDFRVPGVTSISMDLHKYAFAPKGASLILYRSRETRRHQFFACANWTGYSVVNAAVQSSKSGGPLAAAWAVLHHLGRDGYGRIAEAVVDGTRQLVSGLEAAGMRILGAPQFCMVAATHDDPAVDIFHLVDEMAERGWLVQPQFTYGSSPANLHFSLQPGNLGRIDAMLADLADSIVAARALGPALDPQMSDILQHLNPAGVPDEALSGLLKMVGISAAQAADSDPAGVGLPARMAGVNALLDSLPRDFDERLLIAYFNQLFSV